jgi:hypothetical protein
MALTYEPIYNTILGSNQTSIDITSIPQTYTDLIISVVTRAPSTDNAVLGITFNNITSATYYGSTATAAAGSVTFQNPAATTSCTLGATGIFASGYWGTWEIDIQDYTNTNISKSLLFSNGAPAATRDAQQFIHGGFTETSSTSAITSVQLKGMTYEAGTSITMWGVKEL